MTTTTNVVFTPGTAYTWASYPDTWDATGSGALSWDTANSSNSYSLTVTETVDTVEIGFRSYTPRAIPESFAIAEAKPGWTVGKNVSEAFGFAETSAMRSALNHMIGESFSIAEISKKAVSIFKGEAFATAEARKNTVGKNSTEAFAITFSPTAEFTRQVTFYRTFTETFNTLDQRPGVFTPTAYLETIHFVDAFIKNITKKMPEAFSTTDGFSRVAGFVRTFPETTNFAEIGKRSFSKTLQESFHLQDMWIKKGPVTATDMVLREDALTYADFLSAVGSDAPISYNDYVPFIVGDYNVSKFSVKVVMTRDNISQDTKLTAGKVYADVPDVNDKGRATTSASVVTTVPFNRKFATPPEVTVVNVSSSTFGQPRITNVTSNSFDVDLINASNARIVGTVSWNALGH